MAHGLFVFPLYHNHATRTMCLLQVDVTLLDFRFDAKITIYHLRFYPVGIVVSRSKMLFKPEENLHFPIISIEIRMEVFD